MAESQPISRYLRAEYTDSGTDAELWQPAPGGQAKRLLNRSASKSCSTFVGLTRCNRSYRRARGEASPTSLPRAGGQDTSLVFWTSVSTLKNIWVSRPQRKQEEWLFPTGTPAGCQFRHIPMGRHKWGQILKSRGEK